MPRITRSRKSASTRAHTASTPTYSSLPVADLGPQSRASRRSSAPYLGSTKSRSRPRTSASTYLETSSDPNVICAVTESRGTSPTVGLAYVDLSTSRAVLCQIADNQTYTRTIHKLWIWDPNVLIVPSTSVSPSKSKLIMFLEASPDIVVQPTSIDRKHFSEMDGQDLIENLGLRDEADSLKVAIEGKYYAIACLSAVLQFIKHTNGTSIASCSLRISFEPSEGSMMVDLASVHSLEIVQNLRDRKSPDCLLGLLNDTLTPMGSRLLRSNILQPLVDADVLLLRYQAVEELSTNEQMFLAVRKALKGFLDVDRALTNLVMAPRQSKIEEWLQYGVNHVLVLKSYLAAAKTVFEAIQIPKSTLLIQIVEACDSNAYREVENVINDWINEDTTFSRKPAELQAQRTFAIKSGNNGMLDVARQVFKETLDDIHEHCDDLNSSSGFKFSLEFDNKRGRYLRLPLSELQEGNFDTEIFINAVKSKRHVECQTMDLVKLNNKLSCAQVEVMNLSLSAIQELIELIRINIAPLFRMSDSIALLDVLASFASIATQFECVKPSLGPTIAVKAARHPIKIKISKSKFIPNDCYVSKSSRMQIITGCNMSGKSTYIRTIALMQIMAQVGSFVPAEYASFSIRNQLFARVSTDDNLIANVSTFASEMREAAFILRNADEKSLVIVDELGRGTSTGDGLGIAAAIAEALMQSNAIVWFVTHFHDLAKFMAGYGSVTNLHLETELHREASTMVMLYKVASGPAKETSYGIEMAQTVGLPESVIAEARRVSDLLKQGRQQVVERSRGTIQERKMKLLMGLNDQLLFARDSEMRGRELRVWLKALQDEFVVRMYELEKEDELMRDVNPDGDIGGMVPSRSTSHATEDATAQLQSHDPLGGRNNPLIQVPRTSERQMCSKSRSSLVSLESVDEIPYPHQLFRPPSSMGTGLAMHMSGECDHVSASQETVLKTGRGRQTASASTPLFVSLKSPLMNEERQKEFGVLAGAVLNQGNGIAEWRDLGTLKHSRSNTDMEVDDVSDEDTNFAIGMDENRTDSHETQSSDKNSLSYVWDEYREDTMESVDLVIDNEAIGGADKDNGFPVDYYEISSTSSHSTDATVSTATYRSSFKTSLRSTDLAHATLKTSTAQTTDIGLAVSGDIGDSGGSMPPQLSRKQLHRTPVSINAVSTGKEKGRYLMAGALDPDEYRKLHEYRK